MSVVETKIVIVHVNRWTPELESDVHQLGVGSGLSTILFLLSKSVLWQTIAFVMPSSSDIPLASPSDYHSFVIKMTSPFLSIEVNKQVCDNRDSNRWGTFHFVFSIAHTFCHNACTTNGRHRDLGSFGVYIWQVVSLANVVFWFWAGGCTDGGDDGGAVGFSTLPNAPIRVLSYMRQAC